MLGFQKDFVTLPISWRINTAMNKDIKTLKQEVTDVLTTNILPFWLKKMQVQRLLLMRLRLPGMKQLKVLITTMTALLNIRAIQVQELMKLR